MKLIDIFALGFLILALWGIKSAPRGQCFPEPLEKPVTDSLRGLLALMVVLHHLSYYAYEGLLFRWFAYVGYLAVAVFFFLSGYGLMRQLEGSGTPYIKRIFAKKLPKLVLVYGFFTVIYSLAWLALGYRFTWCYVLYSLVSGSPIVLNSWYILTLVLLYVCFGAVFGLCGKHCALGLWLMAAVQAAYVLLMHHFGYEYHWYISSFGFTLGLFAGHYKERLHHLLSHRWHLWAAASALVFAVAYWLAWRTTNGNLGIPGLGLFSRIASATAFALLTAVLTMKLRPGNRVLRTIGSFSLELYLVHGLVYSLLRSKLVYISGSFTWALASLALSLALAWALHQAIKRIWR